MQFQRFWILALEITLHISPPSSIDTSGGIKISMYFTLHTFSKISILQKTFTWRLCSCPICFISGFVNCLSLNSWFLFCHLVLVVTRYFLFSVLPFSFQGMGLGIVCCLWDWGTRVYHRIMNDCDHWFLLWIRNLAKCLKNGFVNCVLRLTLAPISVVEKRMMAICVW